MRRSSRIVLLLGVFFALVAFVGILVLSRPQSTPTPEVSTTTPTVYAAVDIPLGTRVTAVMLRQQDTNNAERAATAFQSTSLVIGKIIRQSVVQGAQLTAADFASSGSILDTVETPAGMVAMAVQVDQVSGVGTIIKSGDYVDMVVGLTDDAFPGYVIDPRTGNVTTAPAKGFLKSTSVKVLVQGAQVLGTLLPPAPQPAATSGAQPSATPTTTGTALTGQQELVIIAVTDQQAEVIKFAQMDGSISLVLRSSADFVDATGNKVTPSSVPTTGIVLKTLIDQYGVLLPQTIQTTTQR